MLLTRGGCIKLCDFGSATVKHLHPDQTWSAVQRGLVEEEVREEKEREKEEGERGGKGRECREGVRREWEEIKNEGIRYDFYFVYFRSIVTPLQCIGRRK